MSGEETPGREVLGVVGNLPDGPYLGVPVTGAASPELLREALVEIALTHWRTSTSGCHCGGMRLGQSYPHHLADELLPVVEADREQYAARRVADELEAVRRWIVQSGNASRPVLGFLRSRAAAAGRSGRRP